MRALAVIILIYFAGLFVAGCERQNIPQITGEVQTPVFIGMHERIQDPEEIKKTAQELGVPVEWIPLQEKEHSWLAIIIHHSATEKGNAAYFNKEHIGRRDDFGENWLGIGYDFVIGNGTMSGNGEIETTFRWTQQLTGAHCKTGDNWANSYGIGIVLVGNFDESNPTGNQIEALVKLVGHLQKRYNIPINDIYGHGKTPGGHATKCPGQNFNIAEFKKMLSKEDSPGSHNEIIQDSSK